MHWCCWELMALCAVRSEGRLELEINGLTVSMDTFPEGGHQIRRTALYVQSLELRDCSPHALDPSTGGVWRYILSRHRCKWPGLPSPGPQGTVGTPMVECVLEAVRPDVERQGSESMEEYRLRVAIAPLRLRLDQAVVGFLQAYLKSLAAMDVDTPPSGSGDDGVHMEGAEMPACADCMYQSVADHCPFTCWVMEENGCWDAGSVKLVSC